MEEQNQAQGGQYLHRLVGEKEQNNKQNTKWPEKNKS